MKIASIFGAGANVVILCRVWLVFALLFIFTPAQAATASDFRKDFEAAKSATESVNAFAFEMYRELAKHEKGDIFFSPYSISSAMAMLYAGASGEAEMEIRDVMHYEPDVHESMMHLRKVLDITAAFDLMKVAASVSRSQDAYDEENRLGAPVELLVANAVWPSNRLKLLDAYRGTIKKYYGAEITTLDYAEKWREAEDVINSWTEERTRGVIKNLIPRDMLAGMGFVITNSIYFKSGWTYEFQETDTTDAPFYNGGKKKSVKMMHQHIGDIGYSESPEFQIIRLTYNVTPGNSGLGVYSMVVVLPRDEKTGEDRGERLSSVEAGLTYEKFAESLPPASLRRNAVFDIFLPKFEAEQNLDVVDHFKRLGLKAIFEQKSDTLNRMHEKDGYLYWVTNILHKAHVAIDEKGSEAAATAITAGLRTGSKPIPAPEKIEFRADHPFMYFIMNYDTILFIGRYTGPK
ncbi:MAG: serpin family protein [Synergistaceae bacterium]|jgi:serpin B|nr:serpin family protein [Synergistaceae bacterium]